jgi:BirA family biotin operon repressor/biotin-[acetyl-CoA-carboxylase] ligase
MHVRTATSTNDLARTWAQRGAPHGALVTAGSQTHGRGRQGRMWSAPPGKALLMSVVLRPAAVHAPLSLLAGVATCDAIGGHARVKWPNDVVLDEHGKLGKVAGILVEARPQERWAVVGIGVNVALSPAELPAEAGAKAATLAREPADIEPLLRALLAALERRLRQPPGEVLHALRALDALRGHAVRWQGASDDASGIAQGIDDTGRLLVASDGALVALDAGEIHLLASAPSGATQLS